MRMSAKVSAVVLGLVASSPSMGAGFQLKVGERRALGNKVQGAALDNPGIADIHILKDARVEVEAKGNGEGTVAIYTADGKVQTYQLRVTGGEAKGAAAQAPGSTSWGAGRFGGKKIPNARCAEPLEDEGAATALQDARDLLRQEHVQDAIEELERALILEPDAAVVHLYLGSAWAKLNKEAKGSSSYETFVLSCPGDAKAKPVIRLLREFGRRTSSAKPES